MRHFLFLQGPLGAFYKKLGKRLYKAGHVVSRINFSGGDLADWNNSASVNYRGTLKEWKTWIQAYVEKKGVTDILLYGDCRPYHKRVIQLYKNTNVNIYVFEEGYLRPNWVTIEKDGVNGVSKVSQRFLELGDGQIDYAKIVNEPCGQIMRGQVQSCIRHYIYLVVLQPFFRNFVNHRSQSVMIELISWLRWLPKKKSQFKQADAFIDAMIERKQKFYILPLQLQSDAQVRIHSKYSHLKDFVKEVVASFATYAEKDTLLLIKNHPLDNHAFNWKRYCIKIAARNRVSQRIRFIDGGKLPRILDNAQGMVTINSTAGIQAVHHKCPVINLGHAVYDVQGLTYQGKLSEFWNNTELPDNELYKRFYKFLVRYCQFNGSYYTYQGRNLLLEETLDIFLLTGKKQPLSGVVSNDDGTVLSEKPAEDVA